MDLQQKPVTTVQDCVLGIFLSVTPLDVCKLCFKLCSWRQNQDVFSRCVCCKNNKIFFFFLWRVGTLLAVCEVTKTQDLGTTTTEFVATKTGILKPKHGLLRTLTKWFLCLNLSRA